ncbi:MAG TPA: cellulase family glycosylhydrolase [Verrucomicrobiae bacterium]|nr:cellulase family glycosylhydrolase [Verrucomicrobiae bacterium]
MNLGNEECGCRIRRLKPQALAVFILCATASATIAASSLEFLHAKGTSIAGDNGPVILKGVNLGNWLLNEMWMMAMWRDGDPKDQWQMEQLLTQRFGAAEKDRLLDVFRENWIRPRDFDIIKSWGFNVVRLPFNYTLLQDDAAPDRLRPDAFRWLDAAVDMATKAGVYVILDMHGAPGGQSTDQCTGHIGQNKLWEPANRQRAAFLWRNIAEHYRNSPTIAAYDLLNEPYSNYKGDNDDVAVVGIMDQLVRAVREVDQRHLIFCGASQRGIAIYGPPSSHGWQNVGYTDHFYPGVYGGDRTPDVHARYISRDLRTEAEMLRRWNAPFLAGEFNVVFDNAGGAAMMRHYYDVLAGYGWAATMWSYKLVKPEAGAHPDSWYMVTNHDPLSIPEFRSAAKDEIEAFLKKLGAIDYAQNEELRAALTSPTAPALTLREYPIIPVPAPQDALTNGWRSADVGSPLLAGGQRVIGETGIELFGGGRDVFEGNDECHFAWHDVGDHFALAANVTPPFDTHTYAKAGLMYRASLKADAPIVILSLNPNGACTFAFRRQPGARITETTIVPAGKTKALRLVRNGTRFEATALDNDGKPLATQAADLPEFSAAPGEPGIFVLSHDPMLLTKASFTNIQLRPQP